MEWRWIPGWEGHYQVSSSGFIRSVDRTIFPSRRPFLFTILAEDVGGPPGAVVPPRCSSNSGGGLR